MSEATPTGEQPKLQGSPLAAAVCNIMGEMATNPLKKRGHNSSVGDKGFDYVTIDDLNAYLQPYLSKYGLMFWPSVDPNPVVDGKMTNISCQMTLIHAESGERLTASMPGKSMNYSADKAVYAAFAGATKYFILRTFCIGAGNDVDTDAEPSVVENNHVRPPPAPAANSNHAKPPTNGGPATEEQILGLRRLIEAKNRDWDGFVAYVKKDKGLDVGSLTAVEAKELLAFIGTLKRKPKAAAPVEQAGDAHE